jgi:predicted transporter
MPFCRICLFALAFCACSVADQKKALDATKVGSDIALKAAECTIVVQDSYATADKKNPAVALNFALDLEKCSKPLVEAVKQIAKPKSK